MPFDGQHLEQWQKNCLTLADVIEAETYGFDMSTFDIPDECGTAGCIAGTAGAVFSLPRSRASNRMVSPRAAAGSLGFSNPDEAEYMFVPWCFDGPDPEEITRSDAAAALRGWALEGVIRWHGKVLYKREGG